MSEEREIIQHGGLCATCKYGMVVLSCKPDEEFGDIARFCNLTVTPVRFMGKSVIDCSKFIRERKK